MDKQFKVIKPKHGYYKGECLNADIAPTIDTGIGCWHTLIGEQMDDKQCNQIGRLAGGKRSKLHDISRRIYDTQGLSPTIHTMGGGQQELKIAEPIALDEQNGYLRQDGCVGTLTTDGSTPKHNNRVVEPIEDEDYWGDDYKQDECGVVGEICGHRIRKLTPRECFRLMGVKQDDYEKVAQSDSSKYHLAGDSIVTTCLMAIFGSLLDIDYNDKITKLIEELKQ